MKIQFILDLETQVMRSGRCGGKKALTFNEMFDFACRVFSLGGVVGAQLRDHKGAVIQCSSEQFSRFLIERYELGFSNSFRELEPKIIPETDYPHNFPTIKAGAH